MGKCPVGEMTCWGNVLVGELSVGELSGWGNVLVGEMSGWGNVRLGKCPATDGNILGEFWQGLLRLEQRQEQKYGICDNSLK